MVGTSPSFIGGHGFNSQVLQNFYKLYYSTIVVVPRQQLRPHLRGPPAMSAVVGPTFGAQLPRQQWWAHKCDPPATSAVVGPQV